MFMIEIAGFIIRFSMIFDIFACFFRGELLEIVRYVVDLTNEK
jgi:hypothetical protein